MTHTRSVDGGECYLDILIFVQRIALHYIFIKYIIIIKYIKLII